MMGVYVTDWFLERGKGSVVLCGKVHNSDFFKDNTFIHTSVIVKVEVNEKEKLVVFHTASGSEYVAGFDDVKCELEVLEKTKAYLQDMNVSALLLDEITILAQKKQEHYISK